MDDFEKILREFKRKKRRYYYNDSIQSKDKDNMINLKRNKLNPTTVIINKKRIGINKTRGRLTADDNFNKMNK